MQFLNIILAALPALALAQSSGAPTTTLTSTTVLTKTVTLSQAHTVTSYHQNATGYHATGTGVSSTAFQITATATASPSKGPSNAGAVLEAGNVILAGVAGMLVVAMM